MRCLPVPTSHRVVCVRTRHTKRTALCSAVKTHIADRPLHQLPDGRLICPIIGPLDDESLPFAVALELSPPSHAAQSTLASTDTHDASHIATYALAYVLEGRGHLSIPSADAPPLQQHAHQGLSLQDVQAGDTILAPTGMGQYIPSTPEAHPGSLARLLMVLPQEVFFAGHQDAGVHTQSYQSVISTWKQWRACPTVGTLTHDDVQTLLSRRQRPILHDTTDNSNAMLNTATTDTASTIPIPVENMTDDDDDHLERYPVASHHGPLPSLAAWHTALVQSSHALLDSLHSVVLPFPSLSSFAAHLPSRASHGEPLIIKRALDDLETFRLPNQTNVLALVFDPLQHPVPFTFGVEIFQAAHKTPPHVHPNAHEMFFILAGEGEGFCDGHRFAVGPGDLLLFPPKSVHGIDVSEGGKMYCLEFMLPNEMFAEFVRRGALSGLHDDDLCQLNVISC